jgi:hypothetical protein
MPVPKRVAGQIFQKVPLIGDALAVGAELFNPKEPSLRQRAQNAAIVGGGGLAASAATGGLDAIPQIIDLVTEFTGPVGPQQLRDLQGCAPALNVERHLRDLASRIGRGKATDFYKGQMQAALKQCQATAEPHVKDYARYGAQGGLNF